MTLTCPGCGSKTEVSKNDEERMMLDLNHFRYPAKRIVIECGKCHECQFIIDTRVVRKP